MPDAERGLSNEGSPGAQEIQDFLDLARLHLHLRGLSRDPDRVSLFGEEDLAEAMTEFKLVDPRTGAELFFDPTSRGWATKEGVNIADNFDTSNWQVEETNEHPFTAPEK